MGSRRSKSCVSIGIEFLILIAAAFLLPTCFCSNRNALEIGIGGSPPTSPELTTGCPPPPSPFVNVLQERAYYVIQRFKKTITCDPKNITGTWVGYRPCKYKGFFCETPPNRKNTPTIASVDFNGFSLGAPTIAGFIDCLPDLALFHANSNKFKGSVPNLSKLPFLYKLDLSNNKLTGSFPSNVLPLNKLLFLDLRFNSFAGCLPYEVGLLVKSTVFDAGFNQITGPIPLSFGCLRRVEQLNFAGNHLYGEVPDLVCRLATVGQGHLKNLSLSDNYFTSLGESCWPLIRSGVLHLRQNCIPWLPNQRTADECACFQRRRKDCPLVTYIPCRLPGGGEPTSTASLPAAERAPSTVYSAMHKRHAF